MKVNSQWWSNEFKWSLRNEGPYNRQMFVFEHIAKNYILLVNLLWKCPNTRSSVTLWVQCNVDSWCLQLVWSSFTILLSALPHCRIFSKSTTTCEWLTCILDILQFRKTFFKKEKRHWNRETKVLNGHTKRQRAQCKKLPVKALYSAICRTISCRSIS